MSGAILFIGQADVTAGGLDACCHETYMVVIVFFSIDGGKSIFY